MRWRARAGWSTGRTTPLRQAVRPRRGPGGRGGPPVGAAPRRRPRVRRTAVHRVLGAGLGPSAAWRRERRPAPDTTALGVYDHGYVTAVQRRPTPRTEGRLWHVRAGAHRDRDRRHGAADRLRRRRPARDHARRRGRGLRRAVRRPAGDAAPWSSRTTTRRTGSRRSCARPGSRSSPSRRRPTRGDRRRHRGRRRPAGWPSVAIARGGGRLETVEADLLLVSGGWNPNVACGARPAARSASTSGSPRSSRTGRPHGAMEAVGAAAGDIADLGPIEPAWIVPPPGDASGRATRGPRTTSTSSATRPSRDLRRALGAGLTSIEHVKRYTTIGTAADQGKTSGVVASAIAAAILGQEVGAVGVPTYRPPVRPGQLRAARRPRPRRPARPHPGHADPRLARRPRRGLRGRRPVEAAALLPRSAGSRWTRPSCASARPRGPGSR